MRMKLTTKGKIAILILVIAAIVTIGYVGMKQEWFNFNGITEKINNFVSNDNTNVTQQKTDTINLSYDEWINDISSSPLFTVM